MSPDCNAYVFRLGRFLNLQCLSVSIRAFSEFEMLICFDLGGFVFAMYCFDLGDRKSVV